MKFKQLVKTYSFWTALAGAVVIFAGSLGRAFGFEIEEQKITDIIMAVAGVLVALGIVTLPMNPDKAPGGEQAELPEPENANADADTEQDDSEEEG